MDISYQHANSSAGNESFLIRIEEEHRRRTTCILVDAGDDVNVDSLLSEDEHLDAVLLTHAHLDHYSSLDEAHRDRAPILTSPDTATMLDDVFAEGERHHDFKNAKTLLEHVTPIDGWHELVTETVSIHAVPAGHAPGACGFLIRVEDGDETFLALATGDFTRRDTAGYPGFDPENYLDVDALFLTAATNDEFEDTVTDIVGDLAKHTNAGSTTLCTTSGLTGVHLTTLLAGIENEFDYSIPVILVGQVAKHYETLGYDHDNVETIPTFSSPQECLKAGAVTIAGPEVPTAGSSKRLFEAIKTNPNARLVQIQSSNTSAKDASDATGTVLSFSLSNHPQEGTLDDIVETVNPTHVVVEHQRSPMTEKYKDKWDAYTWATGSNTKEILYQNGEIKPPYWVTEPTHDRVRASQMTNTIGSRTNLSEAISPPTVERRLEIDLGREGVNVDALKEQLYIGPTPSSAETTHAIADGGESNDTANSSSSSNRTAHGIYSTTGANLDVEPDSIPVSSDNTETYTSDGLIDTVNPSPKQKNDELESTEKASRNKSTTSSTSNKKPDRATDMPESQSDSGVNESTEESSEKTETSREEGDGITANQTTATPSTESVFSVDIDPAVHALAKRRAATNNESLGEFTTSVCEEFLSAVLRGEGPLSRSDSVIEKRSFEINADTAFEQLLTAVADEKGASDTASFLTRALSDTVGIDLEAQTVSVSGSTVLPSLLDAVMENDNYPLEDRDTVVQAALEHELLD